MAVIPPDAGIRMRMQTEASLPQPVAPVQEIPSDLPELRTGQAFSARIQEVLPENTYKALVAGKQLTLQLPEGAKTGDTLELVVVDRTPKLVIAKLADATQTTAAGEPYPYAKLSATGRMIGQLLLPEGETPRPAALNRGQPLLAQPPANAAELAPALQTAVRQSGLFYESHQAQWVAGRFSTEQLLQEPQGQRSTLAALAQHGLPPPPGQGSGTPAAHFARFVLPSAAGEASVRQQAAVPPGTAGDVPELAASGPRLVPATTSPESRLMLATTPGPTLAPTTAAEPGAVPAPSPETHMATAGENAASGRTATGGETPAPVLGAPAQRASGEAERPHPASAPQAQLGAGANAVPEELRPLVQQQLDAAATQRLVWHGEVWPNQTMDWEVVREDERGARAGEEDAPAWCTRLALDTPRLGRVDASLRLTAAGLQLTLAAPTEAAVADLRQASPALSASLDAAGIALLSFLVKHEPA
jgi:flagellar hook-length control protein FliK